MDSKKKVVGALVCHGHSRPIVDLFYSPVTPDGYFLISASKDSTPMLRNGETGDWIGTFEGHKGALWSCCLDSNALRAASASADFSAKLWDALTGDVLHSFDHKHIVRACSFSEDTKLLLTGGFEKILRIFDLNRPDAPPREVEHSPGSVRTVAWLHSDQTILSSCSDSGGVRLWDVRSGKIVHTLETKSPVTSAEVSKDGRYITTADGYSVKFWDANQMQQGHHGPVHSVRFSPGGESYATSSEDGTVRIWQTVKGPTSQKDNTSPVANGPSKQASALEVTSKNGGFTCWQQRSGQRLNTRLWDVRSGKIVHTVETKSPATSAEVSEGGRYITTADGSSVKFWDANHFGLVKSYDMPCTVESGSLEPKFGNKFIAGGRTCGFISLISILVKRLVGCNKGHHGPAHCVRFSPGGESYASDSEDRTVRIWQTMMGPTSKKDNTSPVANGPTKQASALEVTYVGSKEWAKD